MLYPQELFSPCSLSLLSWRNCWTEAAPRADRAGQNSGESDPVLSDDGSTASAAAAPRPRLLVAAALTLPVLIISMIPAAQFPHWGWWAFSLSLPMVTWAAWPFHRAAAITARHLASAMDTLVSIGVSAAFLVSSWQLFADPSLTEHAGMAMSAHALYVEVAAVVTTFLLLGYPEANARQPGTRQKRC